MNAVLKRYLSILPFMILLCFHALGQDAKSEKEERISHSSVPEMSEEWLDNTFGALKKVKWYRETTSGKLSFEAKFKHLRKRYSVEFSPDGNVEDVEQLIRWKKLDSEIKSVLSQAFDRLQKFRLYKIQRQWTADSGRQLSQAIKSNDNSLARIHYEVEFKAVLDGKYMMWEGLFDTEGRLISKRPIELRPTDNLDF